MRNKVLFVFSAGAFIAVLGGMIAYAGPTIKDQGSPQVDSPVKYAVIDHASSGDNTLVSAVTARKIRVLAYTIVAASAVTVRFESGAGGTAMSGQMQIAANGGVSANCGEIGCFETASATLLNLELSGAVSVDGHVTYTEVP